VHKQIELSKKFGILSAPKDATAKPVAFQSLFTDFTGRICSKKTYRPYSFAHGYKPSDEARERQPG
jgi:hypothetical protein